MELKRAYQKYKSFGGLTLIREYYRMGVLGILVKKALWCIVHRCSLKQVYPAVASRVEEVLAKELDYVAHIQSAFEDKGRGNSNKDLSAAKRKIWFCWLQGIDKAPDMVKQCYAFLCEYMPEREIQLIDADNYKQFVELPSEIVEKYKRGIIPAALFTDLLRLELLIKHGGTWIDSTVLMTNPDDLADKKWMTEIMDADLFMFQYYIRGHQFAGIGNWFITAKPNHWVLKAIRDTLYEYWRKYDCTVDYYIFHLVFDWIAELHPEMIEQMPKRKAVPSLYLRDRLAMDFDASFWNELTNHVCFHKLNYRKEAEAKRNENSLWNNILRKTIQ